MKILEADRLHQPMMEAVTTIPSMPLCRHSNQSVSTTTSQSAPPPPQTHCSESSTARLERRIMGSRQ